MNNPEVTQELPRVITVPCTEIPGMEKYANRTVTARRLSYGDKADLQDGIIQITAREQRVRVGHLRLFAVVYGIRDAPFFDGETTGPNRVRWDQGLTADQVETRRHIVRNLDEETGRALFALVMKANPRLVETLTNEKKESTSSSKEEEEIQESLVM